MSEEKVRSVVECELCRNKIGLSGTPSILNFCSVLKDLEICDACGSFTMIRGAKEGEEYDTIIKVL